MRGLYHNFKSNKNKAKRQRFRSKGKLTEPESKLPMLDQQKCLDDSRTLSIHIWKSRSTSPVADILLLTDNITESCNKNDNVPLLSTNLYNDTLPLPPVSPGFHSCPKLKDDVGNDVEEEEESLLGLKFLTEYDDDHQDAATIVERSDMKLLVPPALSLSLNGDKNSFCVSSDSDEYSTDTVDSSASRVSEATRIFYIS